MGRALLMLVSVAIYAIFFATFLYLIAFVGDFPLAPLTVDRGPAATAAIAAAVDLALILLFGLQHSVMARPAFKRAWTRIVPPALERSVYVLCASLVLILLFVLWRPIGGIVWSVEAPLARSLLWALFGIGWATVLASTFMINHFELFGLSQTFLHWHGRDAKPAAFRTPLFYRLVRHPLYSGFLIAFWATPRMSLGHMLLAGGLSAYVLIAIRYEEHDLVGVFGRDYEAYRANVGMLTPRWRRAAK